MFRGHNKDDEFDTNELAELFSCYETSLHSVKGKDLILFLGETGSGKSSVVSYLSGCDFEKHEDGRMYPKAGFSSPVKLGHSGSSETLIPELVDFGDDTILCDCPGFLDTRLLEHEVAGHLFTRLVINQARSIKAIVICISVDNSLQSDNFLLPTYNYLNALLKDFSAEEVRSSIFLYLTKSDFYMDVNGIGSVITRVGQIKTKGEKEKDSLERKIKADIKNSSSMSGSGAPRSTSKMAKETHRIGDLAQRIAFCDIFLRASSRISIVSLDDPEGREDLIRQLRSHLRTRRPIPKEMFLLYTQGEGFRCFKQAINKCASDSYNECYAVGMIYDDIMKNERRLKERRENFQHQQVHCKRLEESQTLLDGLYHDRENLNLEKNRLSDSRRRVEKEIEEEKSKLDQTEERITYLDSEDLEVHWQEQHEFPPSKFVWLGSLVGAATGASVLLSAGTAAGAGAAAGAASVETGVSGAFATSAGAYAITAVKTIFGYRTFSYQGKAFDSNNLKEEYNHGYIYSREVNGAEGIYSASFIPNPYFTTKFSVKILLPRRDIPTNQDELRLLAGRRESFNSTLYKLSDEQKALNNQINTITKQLDDTVKEIEEVEKSIGYEGTEITEADQARILELREEGRKKLHEIQEAANSLFREQDKLVSKELPKKLFPLVNSTRLYQMLRIVHDLEFNSGHCEELSKFCSALSSVEEEWLPTLYACCQMRWFNVRGDRHDQLRTAKEEETSLERKYAHCLSRLDNFHYEVGNCLFSAIAMQEDRHGQAALRELAVKTMSESDTFREVITIGIANGERLIIQKNDDPEEQRAEQFYQPADSNEYLKLMSEDGTWGTGLEIEALSLALGRPMVVILPQYQGGIQIFGINQPGAPIFLRYMHNHYEPLNVCEGVDSQEIFQEICFDTNIKIRDISSEKAVRKPSGCGAEEDVFADEEKHEVTMLRERGLYSSARGGAGCGAGAGADEEEFEPSQRLGPHYGGRW